MKVWFSALAVMLFACGGKVVGDPSADGTTTQGSSSGASADGSSAPSEKVPPTADYGSSGSSSGSSSEGASASDPIPNDFDPTIAAICPYRAGLIGTYTYEPATSGAGGDNVTISRDFTQHLYGDGLYRTDFKLTFSSPPSVSTDPTHGKTRVEVRHTIAFHVTSNVSRPNAFADGVPEAVDIGWGETEKIVCSEDGTHRDGRDGEALPYDAGTVTITSRTSTRVTGTIDFSHSANGVKRITFDAPFREDDVAICCLK